MSVEDKLAEWLKQPNTVVTSAERLFIEHMREAAKHGVGYGWMQQVIEWEWQAKTGGGAFGPEYYERRIRDLERQLKLRGDE